MANNQGKKSRLSVMGAHLGTWALVLFLSELGLIFLALPASMLLRVYAQERQMVVSDFGESTLQNLEQKSSAWFKAVVVDTGALHQGYALCKRQELGSRGHFDDRGLGNIFACRLDVFWTAVRQMFFRLALIEIWLPVALVFYLPLVGDAWYQRRIRQYQFAFASPTLHHGTRMTIGLMLLGLLLIPALPWIVVPLLVPVGLGVIGVALWLRLSNEQKRV